MTLCFGGDKMLKPSICVHYRFNKRLTNQEAEVNCTLIVCTLQITLEFKRVQLFIVLFRIHGPNYFVRRIDVHLRYS
jgi:hypothetical protein